MATTGNHHQMHRADLGVVAAGASVLSLDVLLFRLQGWAPPQILFWRGVFGAIGFCVFAVVAARSRRSGTTRLISLGGVLVAVTTSIGNMSFVVSLSHTTVAHAVLIAGGSPITTALLARLFLGERLARRTVIAGTVVALGVASIVLVHFGPAEVIGDGSAAIATLTLSLVLILQRMFSGVDVLAAMALSGLLTAIIAAPFAWPIQWGGSNLLFAGLDSAVVLPLAFALITSNHLRVKASEAGLLMLIETVLGPLWVWWIIHEVPSWPTILSGVLILGALVAHGVAELRSESDPPPRHTAPRLTPRS